MKKAFLFTFVFFMLFSFAYSVPKQGGDTIATATVIHDAAPMNITVSGTTAGYTNDYDEVCPYEGSTAPDVVYYWTPESDMENVTISTCGQASYDTKIYVYENTEATVIACNDDYTGCSGYTSQIDGLTLTKGNTYFIVVDGYGSDNGDYDLTITGTAASGCAAPSNQAVSRGITTASLSWTDNAGATYFDIEFGEAGFSPSGTPTYNDVDENPYDISELNSLTRYEWYVRTDCAGDDTDVSGWVGPHTFKTLGLLSPSESCQSVSGSTLPGEADIFVIPMNPNYKYNFSTCADDAVCAGSTSDDSDFYFFDTDGQTQLWYIDGLSSCSYSASTYGDALYEDYSPPVYGTYYLYITGWNGGAISNYTLAYSYVNPFAGGKLWISEVCDNNTGGEDTGFIELYNNTGTPIDLTGYSIIRGTNPGGTGFISDGTSYALSGTIQHGGFFTIGNGASVGDFNTAWGTSLDVTNYDSGGSILNIVGTDAMNATYAYALDDGSKAIINESIEVSSNNRITQNPNQSWSAPEAASNGTPGDFGGDAPLAVTLAAFTAQFVNEDLTIFWATHSEVNNAGWNVYRSTEDSYDTAEKLNSNIIQGMGTSYELTEYEFVDATEVQNHTTYYYWLESVDYAGHSAFYGSISIDVEQQDNPEAPEIPVVLGLHQNYPNPFNPDTKIQFAVEEAGNVQLSIYNAKGQKIATIFDGEVEGNQYYEKVWNGKDKTGKDVASGVYMYKLETANKTYMKKMLLVK